MSQQKEKNHPQNNNGQGLDEQSLKRVIEALIFASDKPLPIQQIKDIIGDTDTRVIRRLINELCKQYSQSEASFGITEVAGGFQFSTDPAYGRWIKKLYKIRQRDYLTGPSLETLAIIAYQQPVTKTDIERIRGVNIDGVINNLLQKGLIRITGRKEVVGRPFLYGTTNLFLQYFGLNSLQELPALPEFQEADLKLTGTDLLSHNREQEKGVSSLNGDGEKDGKTKKITRENRPD